MERSTEQLGAPLGDAPAEPQLEMSQGLEQLAQEIAEAAVEDEEVGDMEASMASSCNSHAILQPETIANINDDDDADDDDDDDDEEEDEEEESSEEEEGEEEEEAIEDKARSQSPVDEASWVLVEAEGGPEEVDLKHSLLRKFLAGGDLVQKLRDAGLGCVEEDMTTSCSDSIIICDVPEVEGVVEPSVLLKTLDDCNRTSLWSGHFEGARVQVEVERKGGLHVAAVTVWQKDLLSALNSLQRLVSSVGLVSYADVDVTSLLARAA